MNSGEEAQDQKSELGLDDYEGRRYLGLKRHLVLAMVSYLFLARGHQNLRGKKPGVDRLPSAHCGRSTGAIMVA
jgi:SRSO17 transposase